VEAVVADGLCVLEGLAIVEHELQGILLQRQHIKLAAHAPDQVSDGLRFAHLERLLLLWR
jgi:hypothetical protein